MDKNFTQISDDLLVKYLLGEANAEEAVGVEQWASSHPDHQKTLENYRLILMNSELPKENSEVDELHALERVNLKIADQQQTPTRRQYTFMRWVAVIAVFFGLGTFAYFRFINQSIMVQSANTTISKELPDGSMAILNEHSSLTYKGGLIEKLRTVQLEGEAFFKVAANKDKPFVIEVNDVKVTVVGTAFNVNGTGKTTIVNVEQGVVKVRQGSRELTLVEGESAIAQKSISPLTKSLEHGKLYNYYFTGKLICEDTPLGELIPILNKKFGADITFADPKLASLTLSTTFQNESLQEILKVLSETFKIQVIYQKDQILLK